MTDLEARAHRVRGFFGAFGPAQIAAAKALQGKVSDNVIDEVKSSICDELSSLVSKDDRIAYHAVYKK